MLERVAQDSALTVLQYLTFNERIRVGRVSKIWNALSKNPYLYEHLDFENVNTLKGDHLVHLILFTLQNVQHVYSVNFTDIMKNDTIKEVCIFKYYNI